MENLSLQNSSKLFIALVKERFHGKSSKTYDKFKAILVKFGQGTMDRSSLFNEVSDLFTYKHYDLIEKFAYYLDYNRASSVESNIVEEENKYLCSVPPDKKSISMAVSSCLDFINRVERVLNDKDKFKSFMLMIMGFQRHGDVERVRRDVFWLVKEHPELEIEFAEFIAEANAGRTVQDMVVSRKRKRKEAQERTDRRKDRKLSETERERFRVEDGLYKQNLSYNMMLCARDGAERLIMENTGRKDPKEEILIAGYFRGLNVKFMREELKMEKFKLLSEKMMERGEAILQSEKFVCFLNSGIEILTKNWTKRRRTLIKESRERDLQIPVFDWH